MIEVTGKCGAGTVVVKLQVVNTVAELRQYGNSTLQRRGLTGDDSWRAGDFKSCVAVALASRARTSTKVRVTLLGIGHAYLKQ
jgi:hypothetical protein